MAVDSRDKRASVLSYVGRLVVVPPLPDGTVGDADRAHLAGLYAGLTYNAVATIVDPGTSSTPYPYLLRPRHIPKARHQFMLYSPHREPVGMLTGFEGATYTLSADGAGSGFGMALSSTTNQTLVKDGSFVIPSRKVDGGVWRVEDVFIIASQPEAEGKRGTLFKDAEGDSLTKWALSENSRVMVQLDTLGSYVTDTPADNAMKHFAARLFGQGAGNSGSTRGRDWYVWLGLSIAKDQSLGPQISYNASLKSINAIMSDIAGLAELDQINPARVFAYIRPVFTSSQLRFEFVTFTGTLPSAAKPKRARGARGAYRGFDSASPIILGTMFGNVAEVDSERDRREGWTSVVGTYNSKTAFTRLTDLRRAGDAPGFFREVYVDAANSGSEAGALVELRAKLNEGKDRYVTRLKLVDNEFTVFERDYFIGDVVAVMLKNGRTFEAEVTGATFTVNPGGDEVEIRVEEILPPLFA